MSRDEFRALTPWSFFLPIALAVMLGVLVAHALIAALSGSDDAGTQRSGQPATAASTAEAAAARAGTSTIASAADGANGSSKAKAMPVLAPVSLPGPSSARRDGQTRACIGGTIAVRAENGWEQEVVEDAPARCMASSR